MRNPSSLFNITLRVRLVRMTQDIFLKISLR